MLVPRSQFCPERVVVKQGYPTQWALLHEAMSPSTSSLSYDTARGFSAEDEQIGPPSSGLPSSILFSL